MYKLESQEVQEISAGRFAASMMGLNGNIRHLERYTTCIPLFETPRVLVDLEKGTLPSSKKCPFIVLLTVYCTRIPCSIFCCVRDEPRKALRFLVKEEVVFGVVFLCVCFFLFVLFYCCKLRLLSLVSFCIGKRLKNGFDWSEDTVSSIVAQGS